MSRRRWTWKSLIVWFQIKPSGPSPATVKKCKSKGTSGVILKSFLSALSFLLERQSEWTMASRESMGAGFTFYTTPRMWSHILKWCIFEVLLLLLALYSLSSLDENAIILTVTWECYERSVAKYLAMIEIHLQEHFYRWSTSQSHQIISDRLNSRNFVFYNKMHC